MDKKRKIKIHPLLIVGLVILVSGLTVNYRNQTRSILQENLDKSLQQYNEGTISEIDFATLTSFPWNRLYIFGPYTSCDTIVKALKNPTFWPTCFLETGSFVDEGESFFVFTNHRLVKQYLLSNQGLLFYKRLEGFTIQDARFKLNENELLVGINDE